MSQLSGVPVKWRKTYGNVKEFSIRLENGLTERESQLFVVPAIDSILYFLSSCTENAIESILYFLSSCTENAIESILYFLSSCTENAIESILYFPSSCTENEVG